ncbi:MAG: MBL fold metallo-hydrolase [Clostridia bacterium]|nr:MBL fold metallo-hydrolase [Clostridia bacterium]
MKVIKVKPRGFASNSYILTADGKRAVVIDCAQPHVYEVCNKENLIPEYVLLTHGHFDHVGGCGKFFKEGAKICCGEKEEPLIFSAENKGLFGGVYIPEFEIERTFSDGEEVELCGIKIKVIATPGHTSGGVCYLAGDCLFSGDTLFREGVGRCDLPTGSSAELIKSVKKLLNLKGNCKVYCGHDEDTTLDYERENNPYV